MKTIARDVVLTVTPSRGSGKASASSDASSSPATPASVAAPGRSRIRVTTAAVTAAAPAAATGRTIGHVRLASSGRTSLSQRGARWSVRSRFPYGSFSVRSLAPICGLRRPRPRGFSMPRAVRTGQIGHPGHMRLLQRNKRETDDSSERPLPDEAPEPQPEHDEAQLGDPGLTDLSKRDYFAIVRRAAKRFNDDHMTSI